MAPGARITIDGFDELAEQSELFAERVRSAGVGLEEPIDDAVDQVAQDILDTAQDKAPVESGELVSSGAIESDGEGRRSVVFDADHAGAIEYGSKPSAPYTIEADEADALKFTVDERRLVEFEDQEFAQIITESQEVIVDSVEHPGVEAQPFLRPAIRLHRHNLGEKISDALDSHLDEFFGS